MILTGHEIKQRLNKDIKITPFNPKQLNPNSYNLKLHDTLIVYENIKTIEGHKVKLPLDVKKNNKTKELKIPKFGLTLKPGKLYLGRTVEYTETDNLVPLLSGRSSLARLGISIHVTAGFGDVGFNGTWTLEISCIEPVTIYPNIEFCQIYYNTIEGKVGAKYKGKYQNQKNIESSRLYKEFKNKKC